MLLEVSLAFLFGWTINDLGNRLQERETFVDGLGGGIATSIHYHGCTLRKVCSHVGILAEQRKDRKKFLNRDREQLLLILIFHHKFK